jgi:hypothetical protein
MRNRRAKADPELMRQLDAVAARDQSVEAVFTLRPDASPRADSGPERTEEIASRVLARVKERVGLDADQVNIFRHFSSFAVCAPACFVRELLTQPEIASAMANRRFDP